MGLAVTENPDVILLDMNMPGTNGLDLCRRLKADPQTAEIPVIFLTASSDVTIKVHCFDIGATDYVTKPFHPEELRARVRAALRTKRTHDDLGVQARLDALTGLRNRGQFDRILSTEIDVALRDGKPMSLIMIDLDSFKKLNDTFGHAFGDAVLRGAAQVVTLGIRGADLACRYGGEELAVVLPNTAGRSAAEVAERLREGLVAQEFKHKADEPSVLVTASFGVADLDYVKALHGTVTPEGTVEAADEALYLAKRDGRNRVVVNPRFRPSLAVQPRLRAS